MSENPGQGQARGAFLTEGEFFPELVSRLARALDVRHAIATELVRGDEWVCRPLAFCSERKLLEIPEYETRNTPCDIVLRLGAYFCADGLREKFPEDPHFEVLDVRSYRGIAIRTEDDEIVGHIGVLDDRPMAESDTDSAIMEAYSAAASLEIRRRRAVRERMETAERLSTLVDAIPDPVCLKDGDGRWLYVNEAVIRLLHLNGIAWRGKTGLELGEIQPQFADVLRELARVDEEVWQTREPLVREETVPSGDGAVLIFEAVRVPLFTTTGARRGLVTVARDVTARKNAESALEKSEARFQRVSESIPGAIYSYIRHPDDTRTLLYVSPGLTDLIGAKAATDLSGNVQRFRDECVHPEDATAFEEAMSLSSETFNPLGHDFRIRTTAGPYKWVRSIAQPIRAGEGNVLWYGFLLDITDRKDVALHLGGSREGERPGSIEAGSAFEHAVHDVELGLASLVGGALGGAIPESKDDRAARRTIARLGEQLLDALSDYRGLVEDREEGSSSAPRP